MDDLHLVAGFLDARNDVFPADDSRTVNIHVILDVTSQCQVGSFDVIHRVSIPISTQGIQIEHRAGGKSVGGQQF